MFQKTLAGQELRGEDIIMPCNRAQSFKIWIKFEFNPQALKVTEKFLF